jgi:hypothetical protein
MHRANLIFMIAAPVLCAIAVLLGVVVVGQVLLATLHWAEHAYHVEAYTGEAKKQVLAQAKLYPVAVALAFGALALVGGAVASRLAPQRPTHDGAHH